MKKWVIGILIVLAATIFSVYVFIPNTVRIKTNTTIGATSPGLHRMLLNKENVAKWWPGTISNDSFYLNDIAYSINSGNITVLPISISGPGNDMVSSLYLISINIDSTQLEWVGSMASSYNPVKRFSVYQKAKKINRDMGTILEKMKAFYSRPENIYVFDIRKTMVVDSLLIATGSSCKGYPTTGFIYNLINKLRMYALKNTANEKGYPMLNVSTIDSINFNVKVAIPIDKALPSLGDILQKRMMGRGNILVTEVKGGIETTTKAVDQMQKYADDYQRKAPAIPFYSLITDRTKESDSSNWITKIYFPVM